MNSWRYGGFVSATSNSGVSFRVSSLYWFPISPMRVATPVMELEAKYSW